MEVKVLKKNNKGMSLVELLVAVAIFVAAIVPMLYAFVYSTGFNFKAQRLMQSTGISQAIIEKCKGANTDAQDIVDMLTDGSIFDGTKFGHGAASHSGTEYWIEEVRAAAVDAGEAVDAGNGSRRYYDVKVNFEYIPVSTTDTSSIQSMSGFTGNFCDSYTAFLRTADSNAQAAMLDELVSLFADSNVYTTSGTSMASHAGIADKFGATDDAKKTNILVNRLVIERNIIITANDNGVNVKVEYYFAGFDTPSDDGHGNLIYDGVADTDVFVSKGVTASVGGTSYNLVCKATYNAHSLSSGSPFYVADVDNDGTVDNDGVYILGGADPADAKPGSAVFFYYYPSFKTSGASVASFHDNFVLKNDMSSAYAPAGNSIDRFDFYLFKQYDSSFASAHLDYISEFDYKYVPEINMTSAGFDTYLHHNFFYEIDEDGTSTHSNTTSFASVSVYTSHIHCGTHCHNSTVNEPDNGYATDFRNPDTSLPSNQYMKATILSDDAVLPYRHEARDIAMNMYVARYKITVTVYPHGHHDDSDIIETMDAEVLNW